MFKKTIITEFFTTINISIFLRSIWLLTYRLPLLRYWNDIKYVEKQFLSYTWNPDSKIISFYNWRSAIYYALKMIWIKKTDEVIVSWYTCVTVSNAVIQSWAKIIYSDIEKKNLWLDVIKLQKNITNNTKVIIVQHTFWKPSNIKDIIKLAKFNNILVIEDCAHSLWSRIDWIKMWCFWDFAIYSTGRDKVISSVTWGFLMINNKKYFSEIKKIKATLNMPSIWLTIRNLFYNLLAYKAYKMYDFFKIWRIIIFLSRKLHFITEILTLEEKNCNFKDFNLKLPNSLAYLASKDLEKVKLISNHRRWLWSYYDDLIINKYIKPLFKNVKWEKNNYFRYPILLKTERLKIELYNYMKKNNVLLWNTWSWINIVPVWTNLNKAKYIIWSCPISEDISKRILLLPNHSLISIDDADIVVKLLNNFKK
jgi:dTDP-4-amino-4,6-dideoxygalactose transaminase